ncbi:MAG: DUF3014 domain-containing protein [Myxococcaceae bacterium]
MSSNPNEPLAPAPPATPPAPRGRTAVVVIASLGVLGVAAAGLYFLKQGEALLPSAEPTSEATPPAPATEAVAPAPKQEHAASPALPTLDGSDDFFRTWARQVMGDANVHAWLSSPGLLRRLAAAVSSAAEGESPAALLPFFVPEAPFEVDEQGEQAFIAPASWERYDALTTLVAKLDAKQAASAVDAMNPLLSQAWREIGRPGTTFKSALGEVLDRLLAVPVIDADVEVVPKGAVWAYADPELEGLSPVQKHLLRLGPENVQKVQAKLRELREALGETTGRR